MSDEFDRQGLSAMVDYWISPAAVKREFEATKSKYLNGTNGRFCLACRTGKRQESAVAPDSRSALASCLPPLA